MDINISKGHYMFIILENIVILYYNQKYVTRVIPCKL